MDCLLTCFTTIFFFVGCVTQEVASQSEENRLQQSLCFSMYQGFVFTYDSMLASQVRGFSRCSGQTKG